MANIATRMSALPVQTAPTSPILDDSLYRIILKAKIILNQWKGTKAELYDFWTRYFPQYPVFIQDNQDMTMNVLIYGMAPGILQDLVRNGYIVPKPAGVRINYAFPTDAVFSYDFNTPYLKGYNEGSWVEF